MLAEGRRCGISSHGKMSGLMAEAASDGGALASGLGAVSGERRVVRSRSERARTSKRAAEPRISSSIGTISSERMASPGWANRWPEPLSLYLADSQVGVGGAGEKVEAYGGEFRFRELRLESRVRLETSLGGVFVEQRQLDQILIRESVSPIIGHRRGLL